MNTNEKKLIDSLKYHAKDHNPTITPHPFYKDRFQVTYFYVDDHADLFLTVRALIYLCQRAIEPEFFESEPADDEYIYVKQALAVAHRLMPIGEEALMDLINRYYREEKLRDGLKSTLINNEEKPVEQSDKST